MHEIRRDRPAGGGWSVIPPALCLLLAVAMPSLSWGQTATPTNTPTHTPTNTPTNTPTVVMLDSRPSAPEGWWYDRAKCNGPQSVLVNTVPMFVGVCDRTGGRWTDVVEAPAGYVGGGIRVRPSAYKLAATAATGDLTISCAAQCIADGAAVTATLGTPQTVTWAVGSYSQHDRMAGVTSTITPSGTCAGLSSILVECTVTAAPTNPALYPVGPMEIEVLE